MEILPESEPSIGGSSFINVSLKVAFKPGHLHGTTLSHGAGKSIIAITFSCRISYAWIEALERDGKPLVLDEVVEKDEIVA